MVLHGIDNLKKHVIYRCLGHVLPELRVGRKDARLVHNGWRFRHEQAASLLEMPLIVLATINRQFIEVPLRQPRAAAMSLLRNSQRVIVPHCAD